MKNILAVFNCLVKVRYPNGEYHTEDDRYWMQSHQDLFETLEEAEKYISEIFDDVYERIDSDDPEECPYDLVNDEYDIYIKILRQILTWQDMILVPWICYVLTMISEPTANI